jgi:hypothetical protein
MLLRIKNQGTYGRVNDTTPWNYGTAKNAWSVRRSVRLAHESERVGEKFRAAEIA